MEMPVDKVREIMKIAQEPVSLETPIGEEEDSHLGDFIEDPVASPRPTPPPHSFSRGRGLTGLPGWPPGSARGPSWPSALRAGGGATSDRKGTRPDFNHP